MNQNPPIADAEKPYVPGPPQKAASMVTYKRLLRKAIRKNAAEQEVNFLNITAMMDMMTIILVFLLKTMTATSASAPQSSDLTVPKSILTTEASQEGVVVQVTKSQIVVDDRLVVTVPADATHGVEAKYKRSGSANDLYITPLAESLKSWREQDKAKRRAFGSADLNSEAIIVADQDTPYRLFTEVLFTLGQSEISRFHILLMPGAKK